MAIPSTYLTSTRNLDAILSAIQTAQAPSRFNRGFLENLGYKSSSDRLIINVLKVLGLLSGDGSPTERYYLFLDPAEARRALAEGLREAYGDLFQLNRNAHTMGRSEVKNKLKTLTLGKPSDDVLNKMAGTFVELAKRADFSMPDAPRPKEPETPGLDGGETPADGHMATRGPAIPLAAPVPLGGLVYSIQVHLPESRDQAVYDALFKSLKAHLLQ